jgi:hypothetical protein
MEVELNGDQNGLNGGIQESSMASASFGTEWVSLKIDCPAFFTVYRIPESGIMMK